MVDYTEILNEIGFAIAMLQLPIWFIGIVLIIGLPNK